MTVNLLKIKHQGTGAMSYNDKKEMQNRGKNNEDIEETTEEDKLRLKALQEEEKKIRREYNSLTTTNGKGDERKTKDVNDIKFEFFSDSESYNVVLNPYLVKKIKEYSGTLEYGKELKDWLEGKYIVGSECLTQ